jgi:hypothetical protein
MEEEQKNGEEISRPEFINLFKTLMDDLEATRESTSDSLGRDIASPLLLMKLQTNINIKEAEKSGLSTENYKDYLKSIDEILGLVQVLKITLYPDFFRSIGLANTLKYYTKTLADRIPMTINFENEVSDKKIALFSKEDQLIIYRIYTICENYLIFEMHALNLDAKISNSENELCLEFTVNEKNPYIKQNKESDKESNEFIVKGIRARLIVLNGYASKETDWTNKIKLFIPFPERVTENI